MNQASASASKTFALIEREGPWPHLDTPVTVADLWTVLGRGRRNLQYCFQTVLGVSPVQYLPSAVVSRGRRTASSSP